MKEKLYDSAASLVCVTPMFLSMIEALERYFLCNFNQCKYLSYLASRLLNGSREACSSYDLFCNTQECQNRFEVVVKLYFKVRIHAALKRANFSVQQTGSKRNRKMLKLLNL